MIEGARICLLQAHERRLREHLAGHPHGHERAAVVLFRRFSHPIQGLAPSDRYVAVDVIPFEENWITSSSPEHIDFQTEPLRELFRRCEDEGLVFGFAHNHPAGWTAFSDRDDQNEQTLLRAVSNRNGKHVHIVALLLCDGAWFARTRSAGSPATPVAARHTLVLGEYRLNIHGALATEEEEGADDDVLARQAAAFGRPFVNKMRSLRIGVVGGSGTGSPSGTLLTRSGAGELVFIDKDILAKTNLNRVRGARKEDVGKNKAIWLRDYVLQLNLGSAAAAYDALVDLDPDAVDALATCDVIFGCTDDQIGREVLNAACFMYALPYIDLGLGGWIDKDSTGQVRLRGHYGRVSTVFPEVGDCLHCQGVITPEAVRRQYALRDNPQLTEEQLRERYLEGGGEQAPGVGPFTSAVADYGVATLFDLISGFRKWRPELRRDLLLIDFVLMELRSPESTRSPQCPYCGSRSFLLKHSKYRLGRPNLGVANVAV